MAQTQVGLFYSTATGRLRHVMVPTDDAGIAKAVTPGLSVLSITNAQYAAAGSDAALQALVSAARGAAPSGDRVIYMGPVGNVEAWGYFDAACGDKVPDGLLLAYNATRSTDWPTTPPSRKSAMVNQSQIFTRTAEQDSGIVRKDM